MQLRHYPHCISTEEQLDDVLTEPHAELIESIRQAKSPLLILGAGGKMGPSLSVLARRAAEKAGHSLEVIAVSRFRDRASREWLEARGVRTQCCDLIEPSDLLELPDTANVIYLVGLKFGTEQNPAATWAMNTIVPARVMERFPGARIVALSTANVYPLSEVSRGGSIETDPLTPSGEYPNAAVGRERIFEFFAGRNGTPLALIRLHYAVELRYGVLVDIARKVHAGEPIDLRNGYFSCIWQGDANEMILRALALTENPPGAWNLCRPEVFRVREAATKFGTLFGKVPKFEGTEFPTALLSNPAKLCEKLGKPGVTLEQMIEWVAHWVTRGGRSLNRPTHFEVRDGKY